MEASMKQSILAQEIDTMRSPSKKASGNLCYLNPAFAPVEVDSAGPPQYGDFWGEVARQLETETHLDDLFQKMLEHLIQVVPAANRGALLLCDHDSDVLLLQAYAPSDKPVVNKLLARRAMSARKGFVCRYDENSRNYESLSGIYLPLMWQAKA